MTFLSERIVFRLLVAILIAGGLYRLYPMVLGLPTLAEAFVTEDGYLMLTIARNLAIGLGMSVSDGTIPSNGVQPLTTLLFSGAFYLVDGDKTAGLIGAHLIQFVIAVAGIFTVHRFARLMLAPQTDLALWPWLIVTLWWVSPLILLHTMNGLETGFYTVMVTFTMVVFGWLLTRPDPGLRDRVLFGAVCGVTFLVRNDAVFLIFSVACVWVLQQTLSARKPLGATLLGLLIPAGVCALIAAPWLINNYVNFGSIVPVSGTAQALSGGLGKNADLLPAILFEYAFPMLPVPLRLQFEPMFQIAAIALVGTILVTFFIQTWRRGGPVRYVMSAYMLFAVLMSAYYGLYFGAGWFLSRYLSPLAPLLILATFSVAYGSILRITPSRVVPVTASLGLLGLALSGALLGRYLIPGVKEQGHMQVVAWVSENLTPEVWVGAVQTGTVGYWHDRTINLDGKVNPDALAALLNEGHALNYVLGSQIEYLADWSGIAAWTTTGNQGVTAFSDSFDVIVDSPDTNLAVLKRR